MCGWIRSVACLLLLLLPAVASAHGYGAFVFGPKHFSRDKGRPQPTVKQFHLGDFEGDFILSARLLGSHKRHHGPTEASVRLNGEGIFGSSDFHKERTLEKVVRLLAGNTLSVELPRQGSLLLSIRRPVVTADLECVAKAAGGGYVAYYGYDSKNRFPVSIPIGTRNRFLPSPVDRGQPDFFLPGKSKDAGFAVAFPDKELKWELAGRMEKASPHSNRCKEPPSIPQAVNDVAATLPGVAVDIPVLANDRDPQGDALRVVRITRPGHGSAIIKDNDIVTYTPEAGFSGVDRFLYTISDGKRGWAQAEVSVTVAGTVNRPPVAADDGYAGTEDVLLSVAAPGVLANDSDSDGNPLSAVLTAPPAHGTVALNADGSFTYQPQADFSGEDGFQYLVSDGTLNSAVATVTLRVATANDAPRAMEDRYEAIEDQRLLVIAPGVLGNDVDLEGDPLKAVLEERPRHASVSLSEDGSFTYTPSPDFHGVDTFTYVAGDASLSSASARVIVNVVGVNDPPQASPDTFSLNEDNVLTVVAPGVLGDDGDPDGDVLQARLVDAPLQGMLSLRGDGWLSYAPRPNFSGVDSFSYDAFDGFAAAPKVWVHLSIAAVNDAPLAGADSFSVEEGQVLTVSGPGVLANDTDQEGDAITAVLAVPAANGTVQLAADGSFMYTPNGGFSGTDVFQYAARDASGEAQPAMVRVVVTRTLGPVIQDFTPKTGPIGTLITVMGRNFKPDTASHPKVTLVKQTGGTLEVVLQTAENGRLVFLVPPGTGTGPIRVAVGARTISSTQNFVVTPSAQFALESGPDTIRVFPGAFGSYRLTLDADSNFTVLASLSVGNLPAPVKAELKPHKLAAGNLSTLTLTVDSNAVPGFHVLTLAADADVDGFSLHKTSPVVLQILPKSTSFSGRTVVDDHAQTPLAGVTVSLIGRDGRGTITNCNAQTISDAAGNFVFRDLPDGCLGGQLIRYDGSTATSPVGEYAGVDLYYYLRKDTVIHSPILIHLPRIDDKERVMVRQNWPQDQHFVFKSVPNLSATVYAGTTLKLPNGSRPDPFPLIAVSVPIDRLPDEMPPSDSIMPFIVAFQPANTVASQPVSVEFPNISNVQPGVKVALMTLDPTKGAMVMYGTGRPSANGKQVIPDFDPAFPGHRYGLVNFDWHGVAATPNPTNPCPSCCATAGNPVDLSSGLEAFSVTDISIPGGRMPISLVRNYRTLSANVSAFGRGSTHNYDYQLNVTNPHSVPVLNLILPEGNWISFSRNADGTMTNGSIPTYRGTVLRTFPDQHAELRFKDGLTFVFRPSTGNLLVSFLTSIVDANGNRVTLVRDGGNQARITSILDPVERALKLEYDGQSRVIRITDPIGRVVSYTYSDAGNLATVTDPEGGVTQYFYDGENRVVRIIDARGVVKTRNSYGFQGRVSEQIQGDGGVWRFRYFSMGRELGSMQYCDELGSFASPGVPRVGAGLLKVSATNPGSGTKPVCIRPWTGPLHETEVTDPMGNKTRYRFNSEQMLIGTTDAEGQVREFELEPGSNLKLAERGPGSCGACGTIGPGDMQFTYDSNGNLTSYTDGMGYQTRYTYDTAFNKVSSIIDALKISIRLEYDGRGNLEKSMNANGNTTEYEYDVHGQLVETMDPMGARTKMVYDPWGNLVAVIDALGNTTRLLYDGISRLIETMDPMGRGGKRNYDQLNRVIRQVDARGSAIIFEYDALGRMTALIDAKGNANRMTYDSLGRQTSRTTPSGQRELRQYDFNGNLVRYQDRRGYISQYKYDAKGRIIEEFYHDGTRVSKHYDILGWLNKVTDPEGGDFAYVNDQNGNVLREKGPNGTIEYLYDSLNRTIQRQVVGQNSVRHRYDNLGNLLSVESQDAVVDMEYDPRNKLLRQTRNNGVVSQYAYDGTGKLVSVVHSYGSKMIRDIRYRRNATNLPFEELNSNDESLKNESDINQFDIENRLTNSATKQFQYDQNGNLIMERDSLSWRSFNWNSRNRISTIRDNGGNVLSFRFDYRGKLVEIISNGTSDKRLNDKFNNLVYRKLENRNLSYLTGVSIDAHFAVLSQASTIWSLNDMVNSTLDLVDHSGEVIESFSYGSFGSASNNATSDFPFRYAGREEIGVDLHYFRARLYNSGIKRFLSEDPLGSFSGEINRYTYVKNSPLLFVDPLGLLSSGVDTFEGAEAERYRGGIDRRHFDAARNTAGIFRFIPGIPIVCPLLVTNALGLGVELGQTQADPESAFDPQDFISNAAGAVVGSIGPDPITNWILESIFGN